MQNMNVFTKTEIQNMNNNEKFSYKEWIINVGNLDDNKLYKIYPTNNSSISNGRIYISLPCDKILSEHDYIKYNIMK